MHQCPSLEVYCKSSCKTPKICDINSKGRNKLYLYLEKPFLKTTCSNKYLAR